MKKYFTAGLVILLPIFITVLIVAFIINFLTEPFLEQTERLIERFEFFQSPPILGKHTLLIYLTSKVVILLFLFGAILTIGLLAKHFILEMLIRQGDRLLKQIPYVNKIYKTSQDLIHSLFSNSTTSFTHVVYVPFPQEGRLSLGFITCEEVNIEHPDKSNQQRVSVFVPGSPNPTGGCLLLYKKEQLESTNMKGDEGMRFVVSCGVTLPKGSPK